MFMGNDVARIHRPPAKNRDGDAKPVYSHSITGCSFQPSALQTWPEADKSDGGQTRFAVKANAILFCPPGSDIDRSDYVEIHDRTFRVVGVPLRGRHWNGWEPGMKINLALVEKW